MGAHVWGGGAERWMKEGKHRREKKEAKPKTERVGVTEGVR